MQGNAKVLEALNQLLTLELSGINQYIVHAGMCENWGYEKLAGYIMQRARSEMDHVDTLIERILFLEGTPNVSRTPSVIIGATVRDMLANDDATEYKAIQAYNKALTLCLEVSDNATYDVLSGILRDEDQHINDIESRLDQINQMGEDNFLSAQID